MVKIKKKRVLLGKLGLDAHDIGVKTVARWLRDAGMEVIYTGPFQTPEKIISTAIQEDVDMIGISFSGGEHLIYTPRIVSVMKKEKFEAPIVLGGVIPQQDMAELKQMGAAAVFAAGSSSAEMLDFIKTTFKEL